MSKKTQKTETTTEAVVLPTAAQLGLVDGLASTYEAMVDEDKAEIAALHSTDQEAMIARLESLHSLAVSSAAALSEFDEDSFVDAKPEQEELTILTAGGPGLREGTTIVADLLGTHNVFSKTFKENWKKYVDEGKEYFFNRYFKFLDLNGKPFAIWASPTLNILEKIPTHETLPMQVAKNPRVKIHYVGKIEGRERLKNEFGIELQTGNACHVFQVQVAKDVKFNSYIKGCVNHLNSPFPVKGSGENKMSTEDANRLNYEKLMQLQGNGSESLMIAQ